MKSRGNPTNSPFCQKAEGRNFPDLSGILSFMRRLLAVGLLNGGMLGRMLMENSKSRSIQTQIRFQ